MYICSLVHVEIISPAQLFKVLYAYRQILQCFHVSTSKYVSNHKDEKAFSEIKVTSSQKWWNQKKGVGVIPTPTPEYGL
jgi:hypothetical protein